MTHYQNPNFVIERSINDGVRKDLQRVASSSAYGWCTETRVLSQKLGNTFEFFEKTNCYCRTSAFTVKIKCIGNIVFRPGVERIAH